MDYLKLDYKNLSAEQEKYLQQILNIGSYLKEACWWVPVVGDDMLAKQAREIGMAMRMLERISKQ